MIDAKPRTLVSRIADRVRETPRAVAVEDATTALDYATLDRSAGALAHRLLAVGLQPGDRVALLVDRSPGVVVAMLAVLKAGGTYVPLDPRMPDERLRFVLTDSKSRLAIISPRHRRRLPEAIRGLSLATGQSAEGGDEVPARRPTVDPASPAYLIYTSGSTGRPKGVVVDHRNLDALLTAGGRCFELGPRDVWSVFHSVAFDFSVWEIWGALAHGGRCVIVPYDVSRSPDRFLDLLSRHRVTVLNQTPSAFYQLLAAETRRSATPTALRMVIFGGEALDPRRLSPWLERHGDERPRLYNMFGITEITVHGTCRRIRTVDTVADGSPIGVAIPGWRVDVLGPELGPVPEGREGEIVVAGDGVAQGYAGRPALSAERFVPDPFSTRPGGRLYRSGDLGRRRSDGELEYRGRLDQQLKIRGFRIEPGEIEHALLGLRGVAEAAVVARELEPGHRALVAHITLEEPTPSRIERLEREHLDRWRELYDSTYQEPATRGEGGELPDDAGAFVGWNSSLDGEPIPRSEMEAWRRATVERIAALGPGRVLEIGAGTGLLLAELARRARGYWATDLSPRSRARLERLARHLAGEHPELPPIRVEQRAADDFEGLERECFDTVVLSSVIQYFPGPGYLERVLSQAIERVRPGGKIFVGDIRNRALQTGFLAWVETGRAHDGITTENLRQRIAWGLENEEELVVDVGFFAALAHRDRRITRWWALPRTEPCDNEMTRYRFDVILEIDGPQHVATTPRSVPWSSALGADGALGILLDDPGHEALEIVGIPDPRLEADRRALLASPEASPPERDELPSGIDPREILAIGRRSGYLASFVWPTMGEEDGREADSLSVSTRYDVVFTRPGVVVEPMPEPAGLPTTNQPWRVGWWRSDARRLRHRLLALLPEYQVPSQIVVLDQMPLTDNGKLDRRALPPPRRGRHGAGRFVAADSDRARLLIRLWEEVSGIEGIGIEDNFFALGADSIELVRFAHRANELGLSLDPGDLLRHPTIAGVLAHTPSEPRSPAEAPPTDDGRDKKRAEPDAVFPLTPMQQGMLHHDLRDPEAQIYLVQFFLRLDGPLDRETFEMLWRRVVARHPMLRASFRWHGIDEPTQVIAPSVDLPFFHGDLGALPARRQEETLERAIAEDRRRGFRLDRPPLLRLALWRLGPERFAFLLTHHHLVLSEWELRQVLEEVLTPASDTVDGTSRPTGEQRSFADFVDHLRRLDPVPAREFWRHELGSALPSGDSRLLPPPESPRPASSPAMRLGARHQLSRRHTARLRSLARELSVSLATLVTAATAVLLTRTRGVDELVVGMTLSGRSSIPQGFAKTVGLFINTVPLRLRPPRRRELAEWLPDLQDQLSRISRFEYASLVDIRRWLGLRADHQLFDTLLVFDAEPLDETVHRIQERIRASDLRIFEGTNYPLTLAPITGEQLMLRALPGPHGVAEETPRAWVERLARVLEQVAASDGRILADAIDICSPADRQLLATADSPPVPYPRDLPLHRLFEQQVEQRRDAVALRCARQVLTYGELDRGADRLARALRREGVVTGDRVGVAMARSAERILALLAILKLGAAYLALSRNDPPARLEAILTDAAPTLVLIDEGGGESRFDTTTWRTYRVPPYAPRSEGPVSPSTRPATPALAPAYLTYTSGSTGRPKGVLIPHRAVVRLVSGSRYADLRPDRRMLHMAPLAFDASTFEIWGALLHGAELVIQPAGDVSLDQLADTLERHRISTLWLTSGFFELLVRERPELLALPDQILFGGDATPGATVARARRLTEAELINGYGPTENTTFTTTYRVGHDFTAEQPLPIGRPIANTRVAIVDPTGRRCPVGVVGELATGGDGLATGYWRDPRRTAERFVPDPDGTPGSRRYLTGDRARLEPDGELAFLGRFDHQVKIRGHRIEPGEVADAMARHPAISEALVTTRADPRGELGLVGYGLVSVTPEPKEAELRRWLGRRLPRVMVPDHLVLLSDWPLTSRGKIDRRALPTPEPRAAAAADTGRVGGIDKPTRPLEEIVLGIWQEVLDRDDLAPDDDFFEVGGHSLRATQVLSRLRRVLGFEVSFATFFESRSARQLARRLEREGSAAPIDVLPALEPVARGAEAPMSHAQQRLWFLDRLDPGNPAYNIVTIYRLRGPLNEEILARALADLVARHEILRTRLVSRDGRGWQHVDPTSTIRLEVLDPTSDAALDDRSNEARIAEISRRENLHRFDLARGPLLRCTLLRLAADHRVLFITQYHGIADGWSVGVLNRELGSRYSAAVRGKPLDWPPLPLQYADFAIIQRRWLEGEVRKRQLAYWWRQLEGLPPLGLPLDHPRPATPGRSGRGVALRLPTATTDALEALGRRRGATLYMVLAAGFFTLLHRITGQHDLALGTPIANRHHRELEELIGFFVNTLVLRARLPESRRFPALLDHVRSTTLAAYAHQDFPFEEVVEALAPERSTSQNPLVQVVFALQNAPMQPPVLEGIEVENLGFAVHTSRFDLEMHLWREVDGVEGLLIYDTALFESPTVERLAGHYLNLLTALATDPERHVGDLPLLAESERRAILAAAQGPRFHAPRTATLDGLFRLQATRRPRAVALIEGGEELTYGELEMRAGRLARWLRDAGVGVETPVAICLERGSDSLVALLATLIAGGFYVPLQPEDPPERLRALLEGSESRVVVTRGSAARGLPAGAGGPRRCDLDRERSRLATLEPYVADPGHGPDHLCYLLHTSGSTGRPKGVAVGHRAVARLVCDTEYVRLGPDETLLHLAPLTFDASTFEIWGALLNGARLVIATPPRPSLDELAALLDEQRVTTAWLTAGLFHLMVDHQLESLGGLRQLLAGGDVLAPDRVRCLLERWPDCRLINGYGPTENTTFTCCHTIHRSDVEGERIPIGGPITGTEVLVLDGRLHPVPDGVPGELYAGGVGLARGYWGRPGLTAAAFLPHPSSPRCGDRIYRIRDRVRRPAPGAPLDFFGRTDDQVKIRGYRIEPQEIRRCLLRHPAVRDAVVLCETRDSGEKQLLAHIAPRGSTPVRPDTEHENRDEDRDVGWEALQREHRSSWARLFDHRIYHQEPAPSSEPIEPIDPTFDISGWNDTATGEPIPDLEMAAWLEDRLTKIRALGGRRVLEIGCGTGLLLYRLAPECEHYLGTDISRVALDRLERHLAKLDLPQVELRHQAADELDALPPGGFDLCILNSTVQYFPSIEYLVEILSKVLPALAHGGAIFLGDLRNLATLEAHYAGVEMRRADDDAGREELRRRVVRQAHGENELLLDPQVFEILVRELPRDPELTLELQYGPFDNELRRHRYDVVLRFDRGVARSTPEGQETFRIDGLGATCEHATIAPWLAGDEAQRCVVADLPNPRLRDELETLRWLRSEGGPETARSWRARSASRARTVDESGSPDDWLALARELGVRATARWARSRDPGAFDVVLERHPKTGRQPQPPTSEGTGALDPGAMERLAAKLAPWANLPMHERLRSTLGHALRDHLSRHLPDYMVPAHCLLLGHLPLTTAGKIDRGALPRLCDLVTGVPTATGTARPETPTETALATLWRQVLELDGVGVEDNFFDLGGSSLTMIRLASEIGDRHGLEVPIVDLFEFPTVRKLAAHIDRMRGNGGSATGGETEAEGSRRRTGRRRAENQRRAFGRTRPRPRGR